jgi:hypothetical protein
MTDSTVVVDVVVDITNLTAGMKKASQTVATATQGMTAEQKKATQEWEKSLSPITRSFGTALEGMIAGTQTWRQAVQRLGQSVVAQFVADAERIATRWIATELAKTTASEAGAVARTAAQQSEDDASLAGLAVRAIKAIASDAAQAFAGVFAFLAPEMGPAAAGPAAASQALIMASASAIPSADVGMWSVPADMLAFIHRGETILPANFASGFRSAVSGGDGGGGGDTYAITVQAIDTQTGAQFLRNNARVIVDALQTQKRNLNAAFSLS